MLPQGSYELARFAADAHAEKARLEAQVDLFWAQEMELYRLLELSPGSKVLDCGCGTGYLLKKLDREFPGLQCTAVDFDPQFIEAAHKNLCEVPLCTIIEGSVTNLDFPDESFDVVLCRLVLEHLTNPLLGLKEILRVLKPSGRAVIIDNDFDLHERTWPDCPSLGALYDAYRRARRSDGGNPCIGRELPAIMRVAGFSDVQLVLLSAHSQVEGDEVFLKAEGSGIPAQLVKNGFLKPALLDQIAQEWVEMLATPRHCIFRMLFAGVGTRPATNGTFQSIVPDDRLAASSILDSGGTLCAGEELGSPEKIKRFMQNILAREMDVPPETLPCHESLLHLGVDSLSAMRLCNQIKNRFGVPVSMADVLSGKSIDELTADLASSVRVAMKALVKGEPAC